MVRLPKVKKNFRAGSVPFLSAFETMQRVWRTSDRYHPEKILTSPRFHVDGIVTERSANLPTYRVGWPVSFYTLDTSASEQPMQDRWQEPRIPEPIATALTV